MSYLEEFQLLVESQTYPRLLTLWEEYCLADTVDGEELVAILQTFKDSIFASIFGQYAESTLTLWDNIEDKKCADAVLRLVLDLQTTNTPLLADLATDFLTKQYSSLPNFNEKMRIIGLRSRQTFHGAISNFELLSHMDKGKFVFHKGGWGVGEIIDISILREHALIEFEGITTPKDVSFQNAFNNVIPLPSEHFLSRRFGNPDVLEEEGKKDPLFLIHLLLGDLGPKTAIEIKEELCDLVIREEEWSKWWQLTRSKIKKDTKIKSPKKSRERFVLRKEEVPHEQSFLEALKHVNTREGLIQTTYHFLRDFPEVLKNSELRQNLQDHLEEALKKEETPPEYDLAHKIELTFLLAEVLSTPSPEAIAELIKPLEKVDEVLGHINIVALKKRTLVAIREYREDWIALFLHLLFSIPQNTLRDYLFKELHADEGSKELLNLKILDLLNKVSLFPEGFFWYFQKLVNGEDVPYSDLENQRLFLEAFMILLHYVEHNAEYRDLAKKMHNLLKAKRYTVVRAIINGASVAYLKEFLLLASKCFLLSKNEARILRSLSEVVQPSLRETAKEEPAEEVKTIWTTQEGYQKLQERCRQLGTVEIVANAKEIASAREHGDLRENAEYKIALERRSHLQTELKSLSQQLNQAQILTKHDITSDEVCVGAIVSLLDAEGKKIAFTLLGPWEADPENNILSFQSKFAQAMMGLSKAEAFEFQGKRYIVQDIKSYL